MKKKRSSRLPHRTGLYPFLVSVPDRLYPFATKVEGKMVRGKRSYDAALARVRRKLGPGHFGYRVLAYRQACHLLGAIVLIILSTLLTQQLFGSNVALYGLLAAAVMAVTFQEFYLHPRYYGQLWRKSLADWMVWVTPIALFVLTSLR